MSSLMRASSAFAQMQRGVLSAPKQAHFGFALALTEQARSIAEGLPAKMVSDLERPSAFTQRGVFIAPARKDSLRAVVGIKDAQAGYLHWQVDGGERAPARRALKLPGDVRLDEHGNIPRSLIKQLIERSRSGRRATRRQQQRFGVSRSVDIFYGDPGDGRPAGIYKRVGQGDSGRLVPVVVMPNRSAMYRPRLDFWGYSHGRAAAELGGRLVAGLDRAMATAR